MPDRTASPLRTGVFGTLLPFAASLFPCGCASHGPIEQIAAIEYAPALVGSAPAPGVVAVTPVGVRIDAHDECWLDFVIQGRNEDAHHVAEYLARTLAFTDHPGWYVLLWAPNEGTVSLSTAIKPPRLATINFARPASFEVSNDGEYVTIVQPARIRPGRPLTPGTTFTVVLNRALDDELDESLEIDSRDVLCRHGDLVPGT